MAIATLIEYDDAGRVTAKPVRLTARFCENNEPPAFEISLPDRTPTRHRSVMITPLQLRKLFRQT